MVEQVHDLSLLRLHVGCDVLVDHEDFCLALPHVVEHFVLVKLDCTHGCLRLFDLAPYVRLDFVDAAAKITFRLYQSLFDPVEANLTHGFHFPFH